MILAKFGKKNEDLLAKRAAGANFLKISSFTDDWARAWKRDSEAFSELFYFH